jgi:ABC-2 type transport system ATP-binding protein
LARAFGGAQRFAATEVVGVDEAGPVVQVQRLTKVYRDFWGRVKVRAVEDLTFTVRQGEIFGLLGPNGSGKTTTIKLLLGLLFPTSGDAVVLGRPATDVHKNERIGFLPEETYLYKFLNAEETLHFYGRLFKLPPGERTRRVESLISLVDLEKARKRPLKEYSKGMTRRIGLAQALINDPDFLILDEPTTGLDPIGAGEMKDLLLRLKAQGKTILLSSHLLKDVQDVCDRVAILNAGRLAVLGAVSDLLAVRDVFQVQARGVDERLRSRVESVLREGGAEVLEVGTAATSLEDVFRRVVRGRSGPPTTAADAPAASSPAPEKESAR